jgi:hypothetical protein
MRLRGVVEKRRIRRQLERRFIFARGVRVVTQPVGGEAFLVVRARFFQIRVGFFELRDAFLRRLALPWIAEGEILPIEKQRLFGMAAEAMRLREVVEDQRNRAQLVAGAEFPDGFIEVAEAIRLVTLVEALSRFVPGLAVGGERV